MKTWIGWLNLLLVLIFVGAAVFLYRAWKDLRPEITLNAPIECGELSTADRAEYIASVCAMIVEEQGSLPQDPKALGHSVDAATRSHFGPPNPSSMILVDSEGYVKDCYGRLFEVSVGSDRVIVTSPSAYSYYFTKIDRADGAREK